MRIAMLGIGVLACAVPQGERVEVEANELGVREIQINRFEQAGDRIFELRGFDEAGSEVAMIRERIGFIDDLYAGEHGLELDLSIAGDHQRAVTREVSMFRLDLAQLDNPATRAFLALPQVHTALETAHVEVVATATSETPYYVVGCYNYMMQTSPLAQQCCYQYGGAQQGTRFYSGPLDKIVFRVLNPFWQSNGGRCKAADGYSSCGGTGCYYGPLAFHPAQFWNPPAAPGYWRIETQTDDTPAVYKWCQPAAYGVPVSPMFANVNGTGGVGLGCCGNGAGVCGPGWQDCNACGGNTAAAKSYWDY